MTGKIKTLRDKGFGFLTPDDGGKDVFFHMSAVQTCHFDDLREGQAVEFEVEDSDKGPRGLGVTPL